MGRCQRKPHALATERKSRTKTLNSLAETLWKPQPDDAVGNVLLPHRPSPRGDQPSASTPALVVAAPVTATWTAPRWRRAPATWGAGRYHLLERAGARSVARQSRLLPGDRHPPIRQRALWSHGVLRHVDGRLPK